MSDAANQQIGQLVEALQRHDEHLKESEEANEIAQGFVESVRAILNSRPAPPSDLAHRREAAAWRAELQAAQEHAKNMERVASEQRAAQVASKERVREAVRMAIHSVATHQFQGWFVTESANRDDVAVIAERVAEQLATSTLSEIVSAASKRFDERPIYRASIETRAELAATSAVLSADDLLDLSSSDRVRLQNICKLLRSQSVYWDMEIALLERMLGAKS